jgi:hypothetical protein
LNAADHDLVRVRLLGLSVPHHQATAEHIDGLLREFSYLDTGAGNVPAQLLQLRDEMETQLSSFTAHPHATFEAAVADGLDTVDLVLDMPPAAGPLSELALELLDRADEFCRTGEHLLTTAASPDVARYRRWFFGEFVRQCRGEPAHPWPMEAEAPA